jgi:REP element-mobilizing transposase RayT
MHECFTRDIIDAFVEMLGSIVIHAGCVVPVYCFMPDHQHTIITGTMDDANLWKVMVAYKQKKDRFLVV